MIGMLFSSVSLAISLSIQLLMLTLQLTVWMIRVVFQLVGLFVEEVNRRQR